MTGRLARAHLVGPGFQVVHVTVRDGYRPRTIVARAGVPLRLVFHRDEETPCSERVVFSSPHVDRHLAPHESTIVELPAQGPGEVRFTCAMGRYRGLIRLTEEQRGSPGLRGRLRRVRVLETVAGAVLAVATTGLLAIAIPGPAASDILTASVL